MWTCCTMPADDVFVAQLPNDVEVRANDVEYIGFVVEVLPRGYV